VKPTCGLLPLPHQTKIHLRADAASFAKYSIIFQFSAVTSTQLNPRLNKEFALPTHIRV
jgi:hypothetical protein